MINTYADFGMPVELPGADKVVFGLVASENGFRVMGDHIPGPTEGGGATRRENGTTVTEQAVFVSVGAPTLEELQDYWDALAVDATVIEPLAATAWSAGVRDVDGSVWDHVECFGRRGLRSECEAGGSLRAPKRTLRH